MTAGKFLVPDVAKYLDFTIEDIQKLSPLFEKLNERHICQQPTTKVRGLDKE